MYDARDPRSLEKYSSAVSLSDMEIFIFPELIYALALANSASPLLWNWRDDPWFRGRETMNQYRLVQRVKQYIMDHFSFNLDLDTWGLTTKQRELARFSGFVDTQALAQSNALFGYEGDTYYFDIDIRRHFGLDRYTTEVIPYWKTETVEAMHAFRHKPGYVSGAGECVSLSTLYAAAMFIVGRVPLDDIYLLATPLHSQNFIDLRDGIITNNRRIVTRAMWFNGSELSAKARRAIQNERITVVAHRSGHVHALYPEATMSRERYEHFSRRLRAFLKTDIDYALLSSFLRDRGAIQKCFQFSHRCCGKPRYIEAEKVFAYEHGSKARVGDQTQNALIHEIDEDEFYPAPLPGRLVLDELEAWLRDNRVSADCTCNASALKQQLSHTCYNVEEVVRDLFGFARIEPLLPGNDKTWTNVPPVHIPEVMSREGYLEALEGQREHNQTVDLAFTAMRDLKRSAWKPFMKAALERNPVCLAATHRMEAAQVAARLAAMANDSIYDGSRMAQPDEVWNYDRGDGLEKAICLLNILKAKDPDTQPWLDGEGSTVVVRGRDREYRFVTAKGLALPVADDCAFAYDPSGVPMEPLSGGAPAGAASFE